MSLWLMRGGKHGEFEKRFFDDSRIYLAWGVRPAHATTTVASGGPTGRQ